MIRVDESDPVGEIEPAFPYRDVNIRRGINFKDDYDVQSELGRGKFGTVYHCKDKKNGLRLAAKVVNTTKKEDRRAVEREVEIMRRLQHPRLIQLYDAIDTGQQIYVILELIEGGELFERVIDDDFFLTERSCAVFMRQICEGIEFVHSQNILHLDMKPENILCLTKEGNRIKIIDFGLARQFDPKKKLQVLFGTPEFVAPEVVNFDQIGYGTDMWSIGVICYVLLSGLSPFMGDTDVETMANVTIAKYDFDHDAFAEISEDAKDFIRRLLIKDKEKRLTATQCQKHPWLKKKKVEASKESSKDKIKIKEPSRKKKNKSIEENKKKSQVVDVKNKNELDVTKDNLRLFVERWREHPNSPYMMDDDSGNIVVNMNNESISLRGQSPSPRQSICSTPSEQSESQESINNFSLDISSLGIERRASEGNSQQLQHRDTASQIVLAEEIIKLSEHLRLMSMSPNDNSKNLPSKNSGDEINKIQNKINNDNFIDNINKKKKIVDHDQSLDNATNEISEKLSTITRQRNLHGTTFNAGRNFEKKDYFLPEFTLKKLKNNDNKNNNDIKKTNSLSRNWKIDIRKDLEMDDNLNREIDLTPPWRKSRAKHRFGEICRDVPRISNLRNIHKNIDFDEPTSTKNLYYNYLVNGMNDLVVLVVENQ